VTVDDGIVAVRTIASVAESSVGWRKVGTIVLAACAVLLGPFEQAVSRVKIEIRRTNLSFMVLSVVKAGLDRICPFLKLTNTTWVGIIILAKQTMVALNWSLDILW
jgi:hypothetical protein